jgi:Lysyl oxidase
MHLQTRAPRRGTLLLIGLLVALLILPAQAGVGGGVDPLMKPDLRTRRPSQLAIEKFQDTGKTFLRFANAIANKGDGPIELRPQAEDCRADGDTTDERVAYQRLYPDTNGDNYYDRTLDAAEPVEVRAGCSEFHVDHNHWHFENFARYELLSFNPNGSVGGLVSATTISDKVGFCLVDSQNVSPKMAGSPAEQYYVGSSQFVGCAADDTMGISIGWADIYSTFTPGQHIDITGVPDGVYCLRSTADPTDLLDEVRERNNRRAIRITLRKNGSAVDYDPPTRC